MAIGLHELPTDAPGCLPAGTWHIRMSSPWNAGMGLVSFVDGETVHPVEGRRFRQLVAACGPSMLGARRVEDGAILGEWAADDSVTPVSEPEPKVRKKSRKVEDNG